MKTIIISGASKGIGRVTASLLASQGWRVVLLARSIDLLKKVVSTIEAKGGEAFAIPTDITNEEEVNQAIAIVLQKYNRIDAILNNAGVGYFKALEHFTLEEYEQIFTVNVRGTFLLTKAVIPHFKAQKSGTIVSIASDVSKRTFPNGSIYCASKYAQDAMMSAVRKELLPYHVRVCTVYPGITRSEFDGLPESSKHKTHQLDSIEIAKAVQFILSAPNDVVVDEIMVHPINQEY